jgi:hypothetical protein
LADRELNRTGQMPSELQSALSASERKKSKTATKSSGSVIKAVRPAGTQVAAVGSSGNLQAVELQRSSDPSETSMTDSPVVGRVILEQPQAAKQLQLHDLEAGGLHNSGSGRGLVLPFTPMAVAFKDVSYFVSHPSVSIWLLGWVCCMQLWLHVRFYGCCKLFACCCVGLAHV